MLSTLFKTEEDDIVEIYGKTYSGNIAINIVVPSKFTVSFTSSAWSDGDVGFIFEWRCAQCCYVFQIKGAFENRKNQIYFQNGTLINNYPLFLSFDEKSIVWFDNKNWIVGNNETPLIDGAIKSANKSNCPADSKKWTELVNGNQTFNTDCNLECYGKYRRGKPLNGMPQYVLLKSFKP